jgi:hypothetical protein
MTGQHKHEDGTTHTHDHSDEHHGHAEHGSVTEHSHEHTHSDGTTHSHPHSHEEHEHHEHGH